MGPICVPFGRLVVVELLLAFGLFTATGFPTSIPPPNTTSHNQGAINIAAIRSPSDSQEPHAGETYLPTCARAEGPEVGELLRGIRRTPSGAARVLPLLLAQ